MNYLEIVKRQEEIMSQGQALQAELEELQKTRIEASQVRESLLESADLTDGGTITMSLNYDKPTEQLFTIERGDGTVTLSSENYNEISALLQRYQDIGFSYMTWLTKEKEDK